MLDARGEIKNVTVMKAPSLSVENTQVHHLVGKEDGLGRNVSLEWQSVKGVKLA